MPHPLELVERMDVVTGPFAYLRLLGDRKAVDDLTDKLNRTVIDRTEHVRQNAEAMVRLAKKVPVRAFINNHYAGYAQDTARQLAEAVEVLRQESLPW
jgi:uncharacterized protein YecE (DUF72 family)